MVSWRAILISFVAVSAVRVVEEVDVEVIDGRTTDALEVGANGTQTWVKPKFGVVDVAVADARFRSKEEPVLVRGEVVEMAFHDGYRDWLIFTNWRSLEVDGEASKLTGYGKDAIPNQVTYSSSTWPKVCRGQEYVKVVTAGATKLDRDVEVKVLPTGPSLEFSRSIGEDALFEIGAYLRKKVAAFGKRSEPKFCNFLELTQGHHNLGICQKQSDKFAAFAHQLSLLHVPTIGVSMPSDKSVNDILGAGRNMIGKDETVLYKFKETWHPVKPSARFDEMIITDKQIITVDRSLSPTKRQVVSYPFPEGLQPWEHIEEWKMATAKRKGVDLDCTLSASISRFGKTFSFNFDKKFVQTADLFAYHSKLQNKIAAAQKIR